MIRVTGTVYKECSKEEAFSYPVGPEYYWVEFYNNKIVFRAETDRNGTYVTELPEGRYNIRLVGQPHKPFIRAEPPHGNRILLEEPLISSPNFWELVIDLAVRNP